MSESTNKQSKSSNSKPAAPKRPPGPRIAANPIDIICGRGFHIVNHRGNLNLHLLINSYRDEYLTSRRNEKTIIVNRVLDEIKSIGARFIRKVSNGRTADEWEEVDDVTAYKKVSHALRLRTQNESNREEGPIAAAGVFHASDGRSLSSFGLSVRNNNDASSNRPGSGRSASV